MIFQALTTFLLSLGGIIFVDLILSSDNALVIGSAIVCIPQHWRRIALVLGGALAIILRILFTSFATFFLYINYLQTIGGLLLLWVTWRLLVEPQQMEQSETSATHHQQDKTGGMSFTRIVRLFNRIGRFIASARQPRQKRFLMAILAIVITDISTSLDNIIAIAALAHGQLIVLSIGLILSIIVLLIGSSLVALLLERFPGLIIFSGCALAWIAGNLVLQDTSKWLPFVGQDTLRSSIVIYTFMFFFVLLAIRKRRNRARQLLPTPAENVDSTLMLFFNLSAIRKRRNRARQLLPTPAENVDMRKSQVNKPSDNTLSCISVQKRATIYYLMITVEYGIVALSAQLVHLLPFLHAIGRPWSLYN